MKTLLALLLFTSLSSASTAPHFLKVARDVPVEQKDLILGDLDRLSIMPLELKDANFNRILDFQATLSGSTLLDWLSERIHYIVSSKFDVGDSIYLEKQNYKFQNDGILPEIIRSPKKADLLVSRPAPNFDPAVNSEKEVTTVMTNIGTSTYYSGKSSKMLIGLIIPGIGRVPVTSPRVGILRVGPGMFNIGSRNSKPTDIDSSLERIGTLFHEARHSDGNGKSLGLFHHPCPKGHAYAGYSACDFSLNGSYSVGGQVDKVLTENCNSCTIAQKEALRLNYLDSFSRIITEKANESVTVDPEFLKNMKSNCDIIKKYSDSTQVPNVCKQIDEISSMNINTKRPCLKAEYVDSRPEGVLEKIQNNLGH